MGPQSEAVLIPPGGPVPMGSAEVPRSPLYLAYISLHLAYISPVSLLYLLPGGPVPMGTAEVPMSLG